MALRYLGNGQAGALAEFPSRNRRSVALEAFITNFGVRFGLREIPEVTEFCPNQSVTLIHGFLRQVSHSIPLIRVRMRTLFKSTLRLQAGARKWLAARDRNINEIFEHWVLTHANQKKAMQTELYRDSKLCQASMKVRLRAYTKLHNSHEAMRAAVVLLYWERRKEFERTFHYWYLEVSELQAEVTRLRELLGDARSGLSLTSSQPSH
eukprot:RCo013064